MGNAPTPGGVARRAGPVAAMLILLVGGFLIDAGLLRSPTAELNVAGADPRTMPGFFGQESSAALPGPAGPEPGVYRWMGSDGHFRLGPVRAGRPALLRLRLFSGRRADAPWPLLQVAVNGRPQASFQLSPMMEDYEVLLPAEALQDGWLEVELHGETFRPAQDARDLALVLVRATVRVVGAPSLLQQPGQFLADLHPAYLPVGLAAVVAALALGLAFWPAWGAGAGLLALAVAVAAWQPEFARHAGPVLAVTALLLASLAGVSRLVRPRWRVWARWSWEHTGMVCCALLLLIALMAYLLQLRLLIFFLISGAILGGYFLWLRRRYTSLAEAGAGAFLLLAFQVLVSQMVLGAFGWLRWEVVFGVNLLLALLLWGALGRQAGPLLQGAWLRGRAFWKLLPLFSKAITVLLLLATCWSALLIWFAPTHDWDGNAYHVSVAILRAQQGNLARLEGASPFIESYPENAEFGILWTLLGTGSQRLADGVPLPFWLFGMLALFCLARRLGARPGPALIGAALWGLAPVALEQTRTAYNDLTMAALFWLGLNFAYRRPAHFLDTFLAAVAAGLLLGTKYYALVLVPILALVTLVFSARATLRKGWAAVAIFLLLWLAALAPSMFWYLSTWQHFGNPVWPYTVSLGPLGFPGLGPLSAERQQAPLFLQQMPVWQQLWTVWMESIPSYSWDMRLGGFGPLWVVLGLPALLGWVLAERRGLPLFLVCGLILVLHTDPWWTRLVLYLPGLGGIALAVVLSRLRPVTRWVAQALFLAGALYSLVVASDIQLLQYFFLPPAHRTQAYLWPAFYPYRWFGANSRAPSTVLYYSPEGFLFLPIFAGENLEHRLLPLEGSSGEEARWVAASSLLGPAPSSTNPGTPGQPSRPSLPHQIFFPLILQARREAWARLESFAEVSLAVVSPVQLSGSQKYFVVYRVRAHR